MARVERGDGELAEHLARRHAHLAQENMEAAIRSGGLDKLPGGSLITVEEGPS